MQPLVVADCTDHKHECPMVPKTPTRNEKVRWRLREYLYFIARKVRSGVQCNAHENERTIDTDSAGRDYYGMNIRWCQRHPLEMRRTGGRCENTYILLHAKFVLASGATHMRTTEHVDTNSAGRDYYGINIRMGTKKTTRNEKVRRQLRKYSYFIARKVRSGVQRDISPFV